LSFRLVGDVCSRLNRTSLTQTPREGDGREPDPGREQFEHNVAGDLEQSIGKEENCEGHVVLVVGQTKVCVETGDASVAN
jgi:hypothetical protein